MNSQIIHFTPVDNHRLANLCGALDENLKQIETALDITIVRRNEQFRVSGSAKNLQQGITLLEHFYAMAEQPLERDDLQLSIIEHTQSTAPAYIEENTTPLRTKRHDLRGRTPRQTIYIKAIQEHDITFGIGPAGTGKTYLAVACAVDALERDLVKRLVLVRPAVEAGEKLGFLPGDLVQKIDPYLRPLYDALYDLMGFDKVTKLFEKGIIEIAPLAFMRGRTLNNSFIILDEAQNSSPEQMMMFLTRIGFGSKAVITGDPTQIDLPKHQKSGLIDAQDVLADIKGIALHHFTSEDVVRHPLVQKIVNAYAKKTQEREVARRKE
ncbi:PhoH family protein [Iodobacter fluviatilis]|uniref:PhoH-like protein n=1 Tax=Iodobacter fluviatilis TaxID=537 RepID=A0A377SVW7_9NEIS|nr:PhoH family protein [Iodobacter fluviatilis]TCU82228.1 phosphate starvation-inducible PhoH-like protein [Iodobacter fluviatilis]STR45123.1 PhoH-like protein [Iodobacter fluviatilis]